MTLPSNVFKLAFVMLFFFNLKANAQKVDLYNFVSNDVTTISSKILNEDRRIYIHVPTDSSRNKTYPVMYLLDGENHFHLLSAYTDYLSHWGVIPPIIVVGIINVDRRKDLTPSKSIMNYEGQIDTTYAQSGGNELFFQFLQKELIPYIEKNFKTSPFKIFAGHSFGGNTTINCMLNHPAMFDAYMAVSPSLWWDNHFLLKQADKKLITSSVLKKILFFSDGDEGGKFHADVLNFDSMITRKKLGGFRFKYKPYPEENHMTEPVAAYYDALRFVFKNWKSSDAK
jgi:predicted alpha/beta superfamily hydrolase